MNGNLWADPRLCDPENENYRLQVDSPCGAFTPPNEDCDRIGAWPVGCDPAAVSIADARSHRFSMSPPQPNPTSTGIAIELFVPNGMAARPEIAIHDVTGRRVRVLTPGILSSGTHRIGWDGTDDQHRRVGSGLYFIRWNIGDRRLTESVILVH